MKTLLSIVFITLGILYVLNPYDLLPSFIPVIGWIDDIAVTALMIYYMKYGRLPDFINRFFGRTPGAGQGRADGGYRHANSGQEQYRQQDTGRSSYGGSHAKSPYEILGVSPGASQKEIHSAYRNLAQQYHPDKVSHLGEDLQEAARRKFVEIQAAYDRLKER
ncbi:MAG: DnaJ domain-containing protein [Desulfosalsimonadaceae bacterium]